MESFSARFLALAGGLLMLLSLPGWYYSMRYLTGSTAAFGVWALDKQVFYFVAAFTFLALTQIKFSSRETTAQVHLIAGGVLTAILVYKFWIHPPTTTWVPVNTFTYEIRVAKGAYLATVGSALFMIAAVLEYLDRGARPAVAVAAHPQREIVPPSATPSV